MGWPSDEELSEEQQALIRDARTVDAPGRQALVRAVIYLTNSQDRYGRRMYWLTVALVALTVALVILTVALVILTKVL